MPIEGIIDSITYIKGGTLYGVLNGKRHLVFHDGIRLPESYVGLHARVYPYREGEERTLHITNTTEVTYNKASEEYILLHTEKKPDITLDESCYAFPTGASAASRTAPDS